MRVVTIVGARPQFIKAATVSRAIQAFNRRHRSKKKIHEILVHTGQHYDYMMDKIFFEELEIPKPDYYLGVGSGSHARQTATMLERIELVLQKEKPEAVMVYGDTNTTLAGALAAAKLNIPVAHVEAGLRSYNRTMPEEINRLLTDHLSSLLFCPTAQAVKNLLKEGISDGGERVVEQVGDVMYDSVLYYSEIAEKKSTILKDLGLLTPNSVRAIHELPLPRTPNYYLTTLHRAENTDNIKRLISILKALNKIGKNVPVVLPLHPRTKKMIKAYHLVPETRNIKLIEPASYLDMLELERNARAILTDSGGVQKEAYWFKVSCFTLREETEWVETVKSGWNRLVKPGEKKIVEAVKNREVRKRLSEQKGIFGDGKASERIIRTIAGYF
jgi:UDP-GlcNAc3NAcA epimerase